MRTNVIVAAAQQEKPCGACMVSGMQTRENLQAEDEHDEGEEGMHFVPVGCAPVSTATCVNGTNTAWFQDGVVS